MSNFDPGLAADALAQAQHNTYGRPLAILAAAGVLATAVGCGDGKTAPADSIGWPALTVPVTHDPNAARHNYDHRNELAGVGCPQLVARLAGNKTDGNTQLAILTRWVPAEGETAIPADGWMTYFVSAPFVAHPIKNESDSLTVSVRDTRLTNGTTVQATLHYLSRAPGKGRETTETTVPCKGDRA